METRLTKRGGSPDACNGLIESSSSRQEQEGEDNKALHRMHINAGDAAVWTCENSWLSSLGGERCQQPSVRYG